MSGPTVLFLKAIVRGHERKGPRGQTVFVRPYVNTVLTSGDQPDLFAPGVERRVAAQAPAPQPPPAEPDPEPARPAQRPPADPLPPREQLERLRANIDATTKGLAKRWKAMVNDAEAHARGLEPGRGQFFGRGATTWTVRQEGWYQAKLAELVNDPAQGFPAELARLDRLTATEQAMARRLGTNQPWRPAEPAAAGYLRSVMAGQGDPRFRLHSDPDPPAPSAAPVVDWLTAPEALYQAEAYRRAVAQIAGGKPLVLPSMVRPSIITRPGSLRIENSRVQHFAGGKWIDLINMGGESAQTLASLGLPSQMDRHMAWLESPEGRASQDAERQAEEEREADLALEAAELAPDPYAVTAADLPGIMRAAPSIDAIWEVNGRVLEAQPDLADALDAAAEAETLARRMADTDGPVPVAEPRVILPATAAAAQTMARRQ